MNVHIANICLQSITLPGALFPQFCIYGIYLFSSLFKSASPVSRTHICRSFEICLQIKTSSKILSNLWLDVSVSKEMIVPRFPGLAVLQGHMRLALQEVALQQKMIKERNLNIKASKSDFVYC